MTAQPVCQKRYICRLASATTHEVMGEQRFSGPQLVSCASLKIGINAAQ
jgi:hypothetical protein